MQKIAVNMATLESHDHIAGDIERGVKTYKSGCVEFEEKEPNIYFARVPHKNNDAKSCYHIPLYLLDSISTSTNVS